VHRTLLRLALLTGLLVCLTALAAGAAFAGSAGASPGLPVTKVLEPVTTVLAGRVSLPASLSSPRHNEAHLQSFIAKVSGPQSALETPPKAVPGWAHRTACRSWRDWRRTRA
jgi:hypothetical protein